MQVKLAEFEEVRDELLLGRRVKGVGYDGKSVTYTEANLPAITARIQELKLQLGQASRRAFGVRFNG